MLKRGLLSCAAILAVSNFTTAQEVQHDLGARGEVHEGVHDARIPQIGPFEHSIPAALIRHLGDWPDCTVESYIETEFGLEALIIARWDTVKLTLKYQPPEAAIFTVEVTGGNPLPSEWYETSRETFAGDFFDMNWELDEFPGPRSEYYTSPEIGINAQFWAERDENGNITWMRFSYAL